MARNLTKEEKNIIIEKYKEGLSYKELIEEFKTTASTIASLVSGIRSISEGIKNARKKGRGMISDAGRKSLSDHAKKSCQKNGKIWTKPERIFKEVLNECGFGVEFPDYVKKLFKLESDQNPTIYFQYPLQRYVCDYVDINNKIVYAVNGDFWHGNPILYKDKITKIQQHNIKHDKLRNDYLKSLGYYVCVIWESELLYNKDLVKEKIRACSSKARAVGLHPSGSRSITDHAHLDWSEKIINLWFKKPKDKKVILRKCKCCNKEFSISANNKKLQIKQFCSIKCRSEHRRKVARPSYEQLLLDIKELGFIKTGKKYKVSDNAIRKWIKNYTR